MVNEKALVFPITETIKISDIEYVLRKVKRYGIFDEIRSEANQILSLYLNFLRYQKHSLSKNKKQYKQNQTTNKKWVPSNKPFIEQYDFDLNLYKNFKLDSSMFSTRSYHCLMHENIKTVAQLLEYSSERLLKVKNCGKNTIIEIKDFVQSLYNNPELYSEKIKESIIVDLDLNLDQDLVISVLKNHIEDIFDGNFSLL